MANHLDRVGKAEEAAKYYKKARDVGAAHGFFSVESGACLGGVFYEKRTFLAMQFTTRML